jgi:tetratricopeptide (TPR) repeat protein
MSDQAQPGPGGLAKYQVTVSGDAQVGIVGDHGIVNMVAPRRPVTWPMAVGSPPPLASAFQPRSAIVGRLQRAEGPVVPRQVMSGGGGVGKSQIAAGIYAASDADLRVWVAAGSRAAVITGYADAAVRLDLAEVEVGPEQLAQLFLSFLTTTDRRCLVVLDDLTDPVDLRGLWPAGDAQVLVTTRRRDAALSGGGRTVIEVGVYTPVEAEAYLRDRLTPLLDQLPEDVLEQAADLAADLGCLPLGLGQAAAVMIDQAIGCRQYRAWFADRTRGLNELFPEDADADGYAKTVATTWALAVQAANQLTPAGAAEPMARLVAVLDPAGAPEAVFTGQTTRGYLAAMIESDDVSVSLARGALRALHRLSLLTHDPDPTEPRAVRMHHLTGRAVLQTLNTADTAALVQIAADALLEGWPEIDRDPALVETLRANTATLAALRADALWNKESGAHPILFRSGRSLEKVGLVSQAIAYYTTIHDQATQRMGPDHIATIASSSSLASAYSSAGDFGRAIPLHQQTVADAERVLGSDHPDSLSVSSNLADAYASAGDVGRAIPLFEQTLADRQRILGPDHPNTLKSRNNLAFAYKSAGGVGRAIPIYEQTFADFERVLGIDHPGTLMSPQQPGLRLQVGGGCRSGHPAV